MAKIKAPAACPRILISRGWFSPTIVVANSGGAGSSRPSLFYCTAKDTEEQPLECVPHRNLDAAGSDEAGAAEGGEEIVQRNLVGHVHYYEPKRDAAAYFFMPQIVGADCRLEQVARLHTVRFLVVVFVY